jgi:hypothetical protein
MITYIQYILNTGMAELGFSYSAGVLLLQLEVHSGSMSRRVRRVNTNGIIHRTVANRSFECTATVCSSPIYPFDVVGSTFFISATYLELLGIRSNHWIF